MPSEIEKLLFELLDIEDHLEELEKKFKLNEENGLVNNGLTLKYMMKLEIIREKQKRLYDSALDNYVLSEMTKYKSN